MQKKHAAHVLPWNSEIVPAAELYENQFISSSILECIWKFQKFIRKGVPMELLIASSSEFHNRELFGMNLRILSEFMSLLGQYHLFTASFFQLPILATARFLKFCQCPLGNCETEMSSDARANRRSRYTFGVPADFPLIHPVSTQTIVTERRPWSCQNPQPYEESKMMTLKERQRVLDVH